MSALPAAVQRQLDEAKQIEEQMRAPAADAQTVEEQPPADAPASNAPAEPTPPQTRHEDPDWQQRFLTLQGKYNAEMARSNEAHRALQAQVEELKQRLEQKPVEPPKPVVSDEDKQAFGEDLLNTVERIATAKVQTMEQQLAQRDEVIARLQAQLGTVASSVGKRDFFSELDRQMSDWEQTNADPDFYQRWLMEVDPMTGHVRKAILDAHVQAQDVERTLGVFRAYRATVAKPAVPTLNPLEKQVAPSRNDSGGAPPAGNEPKIWMQAEIAAFYDQVRRGQIAPEVAARMEADIMQAAGDGRIR
ncbi:MAG: hypothetical protein KGZ68_04375 [Dechloromonas sp.]|nr:hypothetical protein [Dechloromonas sp.]